ncbi:MAG: class I SAM-dependent methyltransferase [Pseudomonadota bacterium]
MTRDAWHEEGFAASWSDADNIHTNPDRLNQLSLLADLLAASNPRHLLDLGIGSALVEAAIHNQHPSFFDHCRVTGIDASKAMLALAETTLKNRHIAGIKLHCTDFSDLARFDLNTAPDAVICVQALHEVPDEIKQSVFEWVYSVLPSGRPFFILDRFVYPDDPWMKDWDAIWNWMRARVREDVLEFSEYHPRYQQKTDAISSVEQYQSWLEAHGFRTVCPYRCFNRALIIARK